MTLVVSFYFPKTNKMKKQPEMLMSIEMYGLSEKRALNGACI